MKVAIVGASSDHNKYGRKILQDMKTKGHKIYPVNLKHSKIDSIDTYKKLSNIKDKLDMISFVVPPTVTLNILKGLNLKNYKNTTIYIQPGAGNEKVKSFLETSNLDYRFNTCIMI